MQLERYQEYPARWRAIDDNDGLRLQIDLGNERSLVLTCTKDGYANARMFTYGAERDFETDSEMPEVFKEWLGGARGNETEADRMVAAEIAAQDGADTA
jgi:hypothetical protein